MKKIFLLILTLFFSSRSAYAVNQKQHKKIGAANQGHKQKLAHKKTKKATGIASFYGDNDGFDGRIMANGERFDAGDIYTSAHPYYPLGTKLKVTNLSNGRSICVEVKDRMPKEGRAIDLSKAAAYVLGMHRKGITRVSLQKINDQEFEKNKRYLVVNDNDDGRPG